MGMAEAIAALAAALAIGIASIFPAYGQGKVGAAAMESIARQPEAAGDIRTAMILAMALLEALTIYGLLIAFMIISKI